MRSLFVGLVCLAGVFCASSTSASTMFAKEKPNVSEQNDENVFHAYAYNDEYKVYLDLNLYDADIIVPGQEIFGKVPGYFGAVRDSRKWLITDAKIIGKDKAELSITNDYGSEDLTATLSYDHKTNTYVLRQTGGSRLKIVVNRKWVKIPTEMTLVPHERVRTAW